MKQKVISDGKIIISTPNGAFSKGQRTLFSSPFHVNEFSAKELIKILEITNGSIQLYKQDRKDKLNSLWRKRFKANSNQRPDAISNSFLTSFNTASIMKWGYNFISNHLNGPFFWAITPLKEKDYDSVGFSSIVATIDLNSSNYRSNI